MRPSLSFFWLCYLTVELDYVFVDEHNRHKRLKGMGSALIPR